MSVEERLRQQGVKVNGTLDIRAGFKFLSRAFVDEYGVIINLNSRRMNRRRRIDCV